MGSGKLELLQRGVPKLSYMTRGTSTLTPYQLLRSSTPIMRVHMFHFPDV
jgi:hypothetical protein